MTDDSKPPLGPAYFDVLAASEGRNPWSYGEHPQYTDWDQLSAEIRQTVGDERLTQARRELIDHLTEHARADLGVGDEPDSCYCQHTTMPPCSWCENGLNPPEGPQ